MTKNIVLGFPGTHFMHVRISFDLFNFGEFCISSNTFFSWKIEASLRYRANDTLHREANICERRFYKNQLYLLAKCLHLEVL